MFSSEVKILPVVSKESCSQENNSSTNLKYNKNQGQVPKHQRTNNNNNNNNSNNHNHNSVHRKKINSYQQLSNRKKFQQNNNNNCSTKNQNLCNNNKNDNTVNNNNTSNNNCTNGIKAKPISGQRSKQNPNHYNYNNNNYNQKNFEYALCTTATIVTDSLVMSSNTPNTTQVIAVTTTSPVSPASYSLDFLHSVGVQMTAGSHRAFVTSPSPSRPNTNYIGTNEHRSGGYNHEDTSMMVTSINNNNNNINANAQNNNDNVHAKHNYKECINYGTTTNLNPLSHNINSSSGNIVVCQNTQGYHNYLNHTNHYHNHHPMIQYRNCQNFNNNNTNHNNINHTRGNNHMKHWNWNPNSNSIKRCSMSINKLGSVSTSNLNNNNNNINNNNSQSLPRTRNHQNLRNLTYIHADAGRFVGNSRSPTPSPKSESPSLYKIQNSQVVNKLSSTNTIEHGNLMATSAPSIDTTTVTNNNVGNSITGYESDSSHSSYRHSEFTYRPRSLATSNNLQLGEMSSLINFPTYSEDDFKGHQNHNNYGSHQNLTFWNSTANSAYSTYSTSGSGSSEAGSQYLCDGNYASKRRTFRGRKHLYASFRTHSIHENIVTPPDRFLARAHLVEIKDAPQNLLQGSTWDHLSQTIWDKFISCQQTEETYKNKMYLWRFLFITIKKAYPRYGLYLVGSTISGFGADTSDVDMCLVSRAASYIEPRMEAVFNLTHLKEYLSNSGVFEQFNLIEAKVPILRFKDSVYMLEVDLNFNNCVGIRNTHLLHCYSQLDWRLRPLVLVIKLWAQFHDINNAKNMTISSYSLVLMVIHFLQYAVNPPVLPCLHEMFPEKFQVLLKSNDFGIVDMNEEIGPYLSHNTQTLGQLFLQFLEYYSNFDYSQYAISIRIGSILPIEICRQAKSLKNDIHQWKQLCIEEPFDLTNTARSVYDCEIFERVKAVFIASWKILHDTMDLNSVFSPIITTSMSQVPLSPSIS